MVRGWMHRIPGGGCILRRRLRTTDMVYPSTGWSSVAYLAAPRGDVRTRGDPTEDRVQRDVVRQLELHVCRRRGLGWFGDPDDHFMG